MAKLSAMQKVQWVYQSRTCLTCGGLMLQQGTEETLCLEPESFRTDMAARPPSPRSGQHRPLVRAGATLEKRVWGWCLAWVAAKVALQPTANTKMPLSHFAIFPASFFLTLEPLAAPPQPPTPPRAHLTLAAATRRSSPRYTLSFFQAYVSTLLLKWAISERLARAAMLHNRSHHGLRRWYSLTFQNAPGFKTKSGFLIQRQTELPGRRFC